MDLRNEAILVTGASRGLGKELSKAFAIRGARVVMVARGEDELRAATDEVRAAGGEAHALAFDVGDKEASYRIAGAAAALVGPPTIVIHNASTLGPLPMPLLLDTDCEELEHVLAVNLVGPFRLTKALAGSMVLRKRGLVLFLSSDAAVSAYPRWGAYGVSKAALDHLARSLASELHPVRFFAVDPGEMDTTMHADALPDSDPATLARPDDVASRLVTLVEKSDTLPNGVRLSAANFERAGSIGSTVVASKTRTLPPPRSIDAGSRTARLVRERAGVKAASAPRPRGDVRILVVDGASGATETVPRHGLARIFDPGDLVVVNDAATLPASLRGRTTRDEEVELRLIHARSERTWTAAAFGSGDYTTHTEDRPPPPRLETGDRLRFGQHLSATVTGRASSSSRLVDVELTIDGRPDAALADIWSALYRVGRPVQYAHVPEPLALWDVQNAYAARPWAVEMPSAGHALRIETMLELRNRGVEIAFVTHAAGLSSIGDASDDSTLPLPERYEVTEQTWEAIAEARARGRRVIAIGTSVARALEGGARAGTIRGTTHLRIGPGTRRAVVDGILTGLHEPGTSHHSLLGAFAKDEVLLRALEVAEREGLLGHELGDVCLLWGQPRVIDARSFEASATIARST